MVTSQNGWPVGSGVAPFSVAGVSFPGGVRSGDVAAVFTHLLTRFHREVEALYNPGCWGYAYRAVRGQTSGLSNHASGTAVDVNAPSHPLSKKGTFSAAQVRTIHAILAELSGAIRWGGDYSGRVDEMHFEVNCPAAALAAVVAKLRATAAAPTPEEEDMAGERGLTIEPGEMTWTPIGVPPVGGSRAIPAGGAVQGWLQLTTPVESAHVHELLFIDTKGGYLERHSEFELPFDRYQVGLTAFPLPVGTHSIVLKMTNDYRVDVLVYWK